jgi:glutaconate CoA-transferase subunit A
MGAPFLPIRGILGSAYLAVNPRFRVMTDPFSGEELVVVQALTPDVTLVHGSRGDNQGNILIPWVSDWRLAVTASRNVIATVEERVAGPLTDLPDWRLIPAIHLTALVHCPGGAAPAAIRATTPRTRRTWPSTWKALVRRRPSHTTLRTGS